MAWFNYGLDARDVEPQRALDAVVERAKLDENRKGGGLSCSLYEARHPVERDCQMADVSALQASFPARCHLKGILTGQ